MDDIEFLRGRLREYMTTSQINKLFSVGGIAAASFIHRRERVGRPIKSSIAPNGRRWRVLDVVAAAKADLLEIRPSGETRLKIARQEYDALANKLEANVAVLRRMDDVFTLTGRRLLRERDIVAGASEYAESVGVYFLIKNERVVYVGQSVNVFARVSQHAQFVKFTHVAYIPCSRENLDALESLYIHILEPEHNGDAPSNESAKRAPLTLDQVITRLTRTNRDAAD